MLYYRIILREPERMCVYGDKVVCYLMTPRTAKVSLTGHEAVSNQEYSAHGGGESTPAYNL